MSAGRGVSNPSPGARPIGRILDEIGRVTSAWNTAVEASFADTPYRVLVSCLISLRTRDDVTKAASARLFARADTPREMVRLREAAIARLIYPAGFYRRKARAIRAASLRILDEPRGRVPDTVESLVALPGVGRKTANLVVTLGFGKPGICVDTHVHRIVNRLGFVRTKTPDETERVLRRTLPRQYWIEVNGLLVRFGQNLCTPISPHCSRCPVRGDCRKIDVSRHR